MKYADRRAAGRRLADKLAHLKKEQPVVLALPRGGVAVGFEIAEALHAPLDIVLVRKIGVPWRPELALGAVTDGAAAEIFIDRDLATGLDIPDDYIKTRDGAAVAGDRTAPQFLLRRPVTGRHRRAYGSCRR